MTKAATVNERSTVSSLSANSRFIFKGKVLETGRTDIRLLSSSSNTATVMVEQVFRGTDVLMALVGNQVVVVLKQSQGVQPGGVFLFFTNPFLYAKRVVVRELKIVPWSSEAAKIADDYVVGDRASIEGHLKDRVEGADHVIAGRVVALRSPNISKLPESEHDPDWWIATFYISSTEKGPKFEAKTIDVVFANSKDVGWYAAPKLLPAQQAILILRKEKIAGFEGKPYLIIDPVDSLPFERLQAVRHWIKGSS